MGGYSVSKIAFSLIELNNYTYCKTAGFLGIVAKLG